MGEIVVFSKGKCPHCIDAKALLSELEIPYTDIDIEDDVKNSMLMSLVSQRHTVPQIFFNNDHVGGAAELKALDRDKIKARATQALEEADAPAFLSASYSPEQLQTAIVPIKDILEPHIQFDPTTIPEYDAVRLWYRTMFGFLCNCYDHMVLRPEPMALWMGALSSMMSLVEKQTNIYFGMSCLATAFAANCSYCSAHGADLSMKYGGQAPENIKALFDFLQGDVELDQLPFEDRLKAVVNLSAGMTTQSVSDADMQQAAAAVGADNLRDLVTSVGAMGGIMGFLNRWNDLIGVEIEASIKQTIDQSALATDWEWGTHDTEDQANRHDYRDQQPALTGPPTPEQFKALTDQVRENVFAELAPLHEKYASFDSELLPAWVGDYPEAHAVKSVGAMYHAAFNVGDLDPETKHLATYVLALGSNQPEMAADERRIAELVSQDPERLPSKLTELESYATSGELPQNSVLSPAEIVAMRVARVAQVFPHEVRGELVTELDHELTPEQIVELVVALAVAGMGQRWLNINKAYARYLSVKR
ncbi:MAG: glutaredoxin domain-containing protein [Gammaproteobacteria bacterium]|nr:glutaredoxin domain-containing protein [Gammaproteobacteria bacterium]